MIKVPFKYRNTHIVFCGEFSRRVPKGKRIFKTSSFQYEDNRVKKYVVWENCGVFSRKM